MSKKPTIVLLDEINCHLVNFTNDVLSYFNTKFEYEVPGARFSPKFQLGMWDGKISFFSRNGITKINLLPKIIPDLIEIKIKFDILDNRKKTDPLILEHIDKDLFRHITYPETDIPFELRDYQVDAINTLIDKKGGILLSVTGSGKTSMTAALCKIYNDNNIKALVIVPSTSLVNQTRKTLELCGLDIGQLGDGIKDPNHETVVSTWQTLQNIKAIVGTFDMVIVDECFSGETRIKLAGTSSYIADIKIGDKVINYNEEEQFFQIDEVVNIFKNLDKSSDNKMLRLYTDDGNYTDVTEHHEFMTDIGYVQAKNLNSTHNILRY